jgi:biotin carboxyl carrier protein
MRYFVTLDDRTFQVDLGPEGPRIDGVAVEADLAHVDGTDLRNLLVDGESFRLLARRQRGSAWEIHLRGRRIVAEAVDERTRAIRDMTGAGSGSAGPKPVRAPMPGLVVMVEGGEGDHVEAGQGVVIVEAMKMENELKADVAGVVSRIHVQEGEAVEQDQVLIELRDPGSTLPGKTGP